MKDDRLNITFIAECINRVLNYTQDGEEAFLKTEIIQDAVIRNFEIIGEATKNLSLELKADYPDVNWRSMAGFRDVLIHNYINVDLEIVWDVIQQELPGLQVKIRQIVQELEGNCER